MNIQEQNSKVAKERIGFACAFRESYRRNRHAALCMVLVAGAVCIGPRDAKALPKIRVLGTGGTIAGAQSARNSDSYKAGSLPIGDLLKAIPEVNLIAEVSAEQVCNVASQTMTNTIWLTLANRLNENLRDPNVDGVVITHGTDTMEETAYFLSLIARSDKPVVMVGSMRPPTALSADGPMNLYNAIALAADARARGRGVLVVLNDEIYYARDVKKSNTTRLDAFDSPNRGRAGLIENGKAVLFSPSIFRYGLRSEFSIDGVADLPRVEIVYSYANVGRGMIDFLVSEGVKGIVLAGVGDGNTTDKALAGLKDAVDHGVVVVRSSRTQSGSTHRNVEINDDQMGFIVSEELSPQKARILLMFGLMTTTDKTKLQEYFEEY
jgi:L-asparaginase